MAHKDYLKARISQLASLISGLTEAGADIPGVPVRFVDEAGAAYGVKELDDRAAVSTVWFGYEVARGNISGATAVRILGYNPVVDNLLETLWGVGGNYVFPAAGGIQMEVVSTHVADTFFNGGTGVRRVELHYLDANFAEQTEIVTLFGTTPFNTVATDILRVQHMHAVTVGSGGVAAGNIFLRNTAGDVYYDLIIVGTNNSRTGVWTVPAGKTLYLTGWQVGVGHNLGNRYAQFALDITSSLEGALTAGIFQTKDLIHVQDGSLEVAFYVPIAVPARADVKITVISDAVAANAICGGHFSGWVE